MELAEPQDIEACIARIDYLNERLWRYRSMDVENHSPGPMLEEVIALCTTVDHPFGKAMSVFNTAVGVFINRHDPEKAIIMLNNALEHFRQLNNKQWEANVHITIAIFQNTLVNTEQAMYNGLKGIDYFETGLADPEDTVMAYYVMGTIYKDINQYHEAENYYNKGLAVDPTLETMWSGRIFAGLTNIYTLQENYSKAKQTSLKGLQILRTNKNAIGESRVLNDIGIIYKKEKIYSQALEYFFQALKLREEIKIPQFELVSLMEIADTYFESGSPEQALIHLEKAEALAVNVKTPVKLSLVYKQLGEVHKAMQNYEAAFNYYDKYINLKIAQANSENEIKMKNLKNAVVEEKEKEIEHLKNVELKNAYKIISEKNLELTDSINYARRIQQSMLSLGAGLSDVFNDHFIFLKPKDIVSGDFYWTTSQKNGLQYLAVCDSTGHGVPGAFMSLLNASFLSEAINLQTITEPNKILEYVRIKLMESISQEDGKDGMDATLVCYNKNTSQLTYAAANNAPLLIRKNGEVVSLSCDKMPVGKGEVNNEFRLFTLPASPGDMLYLLTDGYADQFGGPKGKKFKYRQLEELLLKNRALPSLKQREALALAFDDWKGNLEQVDDVCIVGVRL